MGDKKYLLTADQIDQIYGEGRCHWDGWFQGMDAFDWCGEMLAKCEYQERTCQTSDVVEDGRSIGVSCDNCNALFTYDLLGFSALDYSYCPNCGARVVGD